jgi:hypothetical protein
MRKFVAVALVLAMIAGPVASSAVAAEKSAGAAALLSAVLPGAGEWYNSDYYGSFPFGECIVGYICFLVQFSSIMDAANGNTDTGIRVDFWSAPGR